MLVAEQEVVFNSLDWFSMPKTQKWGKGDPLPQYCCLLEARNELV